MMISENIGKSISFLRQRSNMTQAQLAAVLDVTHQAVSKWELGQASPDFESLMKLSRLFGVSIEQMLTCDIPGIDKSAASDAADAIVDFAGKAAKAARDLGGSIVSTVGKAINSASGFVSDICSEHKNEEAEPNSEPVYEAEADESNNGTMSLDGLISLAPFMSKEKLNEQVLNSNEIPTIEQLRALAPFVTSDTLEVLLKRYPEKLDADTLLKLAPFIKKEQLFALIMQCPDALTFNNLRRFAPYLKRGMVDTLVETVNKAREAAANSELVKQAGSVAEDLCGRLNEAVKNAADSIKAEKTEGPFPENAERRVVSSELKDKVARAALEAKSWVWLRSHIDEIGDQELLLDIATAAATEPELNGLLNSAIRMLDPENVNRLISSLSENRLYDALLPLAGYADEASADTVLEAACADFAANKAARETIKAYAVRASKETIEILTSKAIADNDWELIEILTVAM